MPQKNTKLIRLLLTGYGTVGQAFTRLLLQQARLHETRYGLRFRLVGIAGSAGLLHEPEGIDLGTLLAYGSGGSETLLRYAQARRLLLRVGSDWPADADALIETTPTHIDHGEPGLTYMLQAIRAGMHVVAVSKGALVSRYALLMEKAAEYGVAIKYSGATAAALPTLDIGQYALAGCTITGIEGILNGTTNAILTSMLEQDIPFDEALRQAQARGIAETNPDLDIQGYDSACKLVLLANALFDTAYSLNDVTIRGIGDVTAEAIDDARRQGRKLKLLATATSADADADGITRVRLDVRPSELDAGHPLHGVDGMEKGVMFRTDLMGSVTAIGGASNPTGAAAAAWKDLINLYR